MNQLTESSNKSTAIQASTLTCEDSSRFSEMVTSATTYAMNGEGSSYLLRVCLQSVKVLQPVPKVVDATVCCITDRSMSLVLAGIAIICFAQQKRLEFTHCVSYLNVINRSG